MFGRSGKKKARPDAITAFLGADAQYRGQFQFQGIARIDGGIIGDIVSDGTLVLGEGGRVEGTIRVAELIANGQIVGDVEASRRVVLSKRSNLRGNLLTPAVVIEDGALLNGTVRMVAVPPHPGLPRGGETPAAADGAGPEAGN